MYQQIGNEIRSEKGVLVATVNGDTLTMAPGTKSQEAKVRAFLAEGASGSCNNCTDHTEQDEPESAPADADTQEQSPKVYIGNVPIEHVPAAQQQDEPQTDAEWQVATIPENELPPFDPQLGINTPGFGDYVNKHKLTKEQTAALIKRICRVKGW